MWDYFINARVVATDCTIDGVCYIAYRKVATDFDFLEFPEFSIVYKIQLTAMISDEHQAHVEMKVFWVENKLN